MANAVPTCPTTDGTMPATNIPRGAIRSVSAPAIGIDTSTMVMNAVIGSPIVTSRLKPKMGV